MPLPEPSRRWSGDVWIPLCVFLLALLLRAVYLWQLHRSGLWAWLRLDPLYYHDWAVRIARGEFLARGTFEMTPLYAYALGGLFALAGYGLLLPRILQAVAGAAACALVSVLGCRISGRAAGLLAGAAAAAYGPLLFHEAQIMKTALTITLTVATAALFYFSEGRRTGWLAAGGAALGMTALSQENINLILPILAAWVAWRSRGLGPRPVALRLAVMAAGWILAVAPATIHNAVVSGELVLITSGGGEVFYTGNNEMASGHYRPPPFVRPDPFFEHEDFRLEAARRLGRPPAAITRSESDAFWWQEGLRFIRGHPAAWLALLWDKAATYLNAFERPDNYSYDNFARFLAVLRLPLVTFGWVAPLGVAGLVLTASRWPELLPLQAAIGAYVVSALLFFTQDRYRMPMIPLLILFAAHAAVVLTRAAVMRDGRRLAWMVPLVGGLALFVHRDPGNELGFEAQNHGILGEMRLVAGDPTGAAAEFRRALELLRDYPGDTAGRQHERVAASAHFGIVLAMEAQGRREEVEMIVHLREAAVSPDADLRRDATDRLGALLMERGDAAGAAAAWSAALQADPDGAASQMTRLRLAEALHRSGRPREALAAAAEALRRATPADPLVMAGAHYGMALILLRDLPDPPQAAAHLREVLRLNPSHPRADWIRETLASLERSS